MALNLTREFQFYPRFIKYYSLGFLAAVGIKKNVFILGNEREIFANKTFGRFIILNVFHKQHKPVAIQRLSTSTLPGRLCWEGSSHTVLLRKLEISLKDRRLDEAWVTFNDFKSLYGFPTLSLLSRFITELSYSANPHWLKKACDLVFQILKEKRNSLRPEILSKLSLSLARAQMPTLASMILRVMLDRENMPPVNVLNLVFLHMVKTENGTCLASNFLVQICDCFLHLKANRSDHAKVIKPGTMLFNLVLDACVRFKSSLKGQQIVELMSQMGVVADAHSIVIIVQIHEMNGQRDEIQKFKDHVDQVSTPLFCHYRQFYDSLLNLHFRFDDIDAAAELVLDMQRSRGSVPSKKICKDIKKPDLVSIGSCNLKAGLKILIMPELLQKGYFFQVEHKEQLVIFRNGKLLPSNRALAKLVNGYKRHGRTEKLSKILLSIQKDLQTMGESNLCSDVIIACILLDWLETAHDILDDMETAGTSLDSTAYVALLTAYNNRGMLKETKALLRQMRKAGLPNLCDDLGASTCLSEASHSASPSAVKSVLTDFLVQEAREENAISPVVYELNSSIYYFCKAKMMGDALKAYQRMQERNIQPTVETFSHLVNGYSSLELYRDITFLWGDIKRNLESRNSELSRDLYEFLLLSFLRGGYFERVMEVIGYMMERNVFTDKWMYKSEFLKLHKNLYRSLRASEARTESQKKRIGYVQTFRKWVGID